jgi:hypothetical protein
LQREVTQALIRRYLIAHCHTEKPSRTRFRSRVHAIKLTTEDNGKCVRTTDQVLKVLTHETGVWMGKEGHLGFGPALTTKADIELIGQAVYNPVAPHGNERSEQARFAPEFEGVENACNRESLTFNAA